MPCDLKINRQALTTANRNPLPTNGTIGIACGSTTGTTSLRTYRTLISKQKRPIEPVVARDLAEPALPAPSGRAGAFAGDDMPLHGLRATATWGRDQHAAGDFDGQRACLGLSL